MSRRVRPRYGRIGAAACAFATTALTVLAGIGVVGGQRPAAAATLDARDAVALVQATATPTAPEGARQAGVTPPPPASGSGRRVVFDIGDQRVWLIDAREHVVRTYLVSGSVYDNLDPGRYSVYSRSRHAYGIDGSGAMDYFVRFAHGERAAIGFHSIPIQDGHPIQTRAQLGTPLSHGCIRQAPGDARRLWHFAPTGTRVVVTA